MAQTKINFNQIKGAVVNVLDYGAVSGADCTTAITAAIATGLSVFFPDGGTYLTTGLHRLSTNGQVLFSDGRAIIKRASGTSYLLDTTKGAEVGISGLEFDGNALAGTLVIWRGHYSRMADIRFTNQGGSSHALWFSGCNVSTFDNLYFSETCAGGILADNDNDTYLPKPDYAILYSTFNTVRSGVFTKASALKFAPVSTVIEVVFNDFFFENVLDVSVSPMLLDAQLQKNITFNDLRSEYVNLGAFPLIQVSGDETVNLQFNGGYLVSNYANTANVITLTVLNRQVAIRGVLFSENSSTPSVAGRVLVSVSATRGLISSDNIFQFTDDFVYLDVPSAPASSYVSSENDFNYLSGSVWDGIGRNNIYADKATINNTNLLQYITGYMGVDAHNINQFRSIQPAGAITVADDAFYEIHGDGGINTSFDFAGVITLLGIDPLNGVTTTTKNSFITAYVQTSASTGTQLATSIVTGSAGEITTVADNTAPSLGGTTDGRLGIQVGWVTGGKRFVRVYNRLGYAITLQANVLYMNAA